MLNIIDRQKEERIPPILRLGFRPFFLLGSAYSAVAVAVWLWIFTHGQPESLAVPGLWWHVHEMFFGFAMAIVAGFLMTAVQNWTGVKGTSGLRLAMIVVLWALPRILLWTPAPLWFTSIVDALFLIVVGWEVGSRVVKAKRWRNLIFIPMLLVAVIANFASYAAVKGMPPFTSHAVWIAMMYWFVLLLSVMGGRVIPFFTARRFGFDTPTPIAWIEWAANFPLFLLVILAFFPMVPTWITGSLMLIAGVAQLVRFLRWKGFVSLSEPLVWSLHIFYAFIPAGLVLRGLMGTSWASHVMLHLFAIGAIGGVILAMIARVTMGHTGREIYKGPVFWPAFCFLVLAALIRTVAVLLFPASSIVAISLAGALWIAAFVLYVIYFGPMLVKARKDGHPG